jgi:hypothetical protein
MHNVELHDFYSPQNIRVIKSRRMSWVRHTSSIQENRNICRVLGGKSEGEGPLGRRGCSWEGNIKLHCEELRWEGVDWEKWQTVMNTVMNLRVPKECEVFLY